MKRLILLSIILFSLLLSVTAKKDINAWKSEKNLEQQYVVFKENLNFWNGSYFLNESQLNEFYKALTDSVSVLENNITDKANKLKSLQNDLNSANKQLESTKAELNASIKNQNAIEVFGLNVGKDIYTMVVSLFILGLLIFMSIVYMLYKRSNRVTVRTKKDYEDLREEFETHKKSALDRYTKLNMELHHTRMQLKRK